MNLNENDKLIYDRLISFKEKGINKNNKSTNYYFIRIEFDK